MTIRAAIFIAALTVLSNGSALAKRAYPKLKESTLAKRAYRKFAYACRL